MSREEIIAEHGDLMRDALAYIEADARDDRQGMHALERHHDLGMLLPVVATLAWVCAAEGVIIGGQIPLRAIDSDEDRRAAAAVVLGHIRQRFEQGGII